MAEVKWVKITTDMFDNRKIRQIRHLPEGNNIVLIWVMLLTIAGRCNTNGMIFLTESILYTPESLALELGFDVPVVIMALETLERFGMIVCNEDQFCITNWEEYQNVEALEKIREQTRLRVAKYRENQKQIPCNVTGNVTVTQGNATERDIDKDIDKELNRTVSKETVCSTEVQRVIDAWNSLGLQRIVKIVPDSQRWKWLRKRIADYGIDEVIRAIQQIPQSRFLMGDNKNGWQVTFDWFIRPNNFPKVLDGNYTKNGKAMETDNIFLQMLQEEQYGQS